MGLIVETEGYRDIGDGFAGMDEPVARLFQALAVAPPVGAFAKGRLERTAEVASRQITGSSQFGDRERRVESREGEFLHYLDLPGRQTTPLAPFAMPFRRFPVYAQRLGDVVRAGGTVRAIEVGELAERLVQQLPHRARPGVAWVGRRRECLVLHLGSDAIRPWHGRDPLYGGRRACTQVSGTKAWSEGAPPSARATNRPPAPAPSGSPACHAVDVA